MGDASRFFRYITPGLVFAIEVIVLLSLLRPDWLKAEAEDLKRDSGIAIFLGAVLTTGGLGFFFSCVHHAWHFLYRPNWRYPKHLIMDHTKGIQRLQDNGLLILRGKPDTHFSMDKPEQAWVIANTLWFELLATNEIIKGGNERVTTLVDLIHSLGTARVASLAAFIVAFSLSPIHGCISLTLWPIVRFLLAICVGLVGFWAAHTSYHRTARDGQALIDELLTDALVLEKHKSTKAVCTWPLFPTTDQ